METSKLKKFAQHARRSLIEQVSNKLKLVLAQDSAARRENPKAVAEIEKRIFGVSGKYTDNCTLTTDDSRRQAQLVERVAYIWFNRFCALRFMDVNRYTRIGVVSPAEGQFQPEILAEAKMGHIDEGMVDESARQRIFTLLDGKTPSQDPQAEAYRLLVVAICNYWHGSMPFMFERIADYTELLMPDDLLSGKSILAYTREAMTPDVCEDVEVIGWLYQFYISEKKNEVFEGLKKNKKITPENIPAATQLFTPHWIVRYLVENSLGRLWMLNRSDSRLVEQMDYYIKPPIDDKSGPESDFLRISSPEEIKICDPACGSGHMLTYAFDLLYAIYEEEGYEAAEIPSMILKNNLFGVEIDERAGELAAFALTMKARAKQRRFFRKQVLPNICVLENIQFGEGELKEYMNFIGRDLFTAPLQTTLRQFEEADNFGSLIRPDITDVEETVRVLESRDVSGKLFLKATHDKVLQALRQADYLSPKYHVVIANPPYMGGKGMNGRLKVFLQEYYLNYKSDLFSAFVVRCSELGTERSDIGIMSPNVWMYIASHERLRTFLTEDCALYSLVELPLTGFKGATVQICAYNFSNKRSPNLKGGYIRLVDFKGADEEMSDLTKKAIADSNCGWFYRASVKDFWKIPGRPIAYWVSSELREAFQHFPRFSEYSDTRIGLITGDNDYYIRQWPEVSIGKMGLSLSRNDAKVSGMKWFPQSKGGDFRRWYGNHETLINWESDGYELQTRMHDSG
ncbi:BREX-1 system adenine-specific DNA-methyltransferase PglX, partial [Thiolapillus sp.]|uniref:BREX-1 system adenine-specific DNA-methyltransferase PglX n=3 Tax=Thiolapillus sp. TaxID=2017437 RepID=UPI003AF7C7BD